MAGLPENIKLSCPMRWGSVYKMFQRPLLARDAIRICQPLDRARKTPNFDDHEWAMLTKLRDVLHNLHEARCFCLSRK